MQQISDNEPVSGSDCEGITIDDIDRVLRTMSDYHSICTKMDLINSWLDMRYTLTNGESNADRD